MARSNWWTRIAVGGLALGGGFSVADVARADPPQAEPAAYVEPAPIRVYRFHVYSTMKARWKKTVTITSLVSTSEGGVVVGDQGMLERKLDSSADWAPVAKVTVKKLLPSGRIEAEIESEEAEAKVKRNGKLPFAPGQRVRLQIDRVLSATTG